MVMEGGHFFFFFFYPDASLPGNQELKKRERKTPCSQSARVNDFKLFAVSSNKTTEREEGDEYINTLFLPLKGSGIKNTRVSVN